MNFRGAATSGLAVDEDGGRAPWARDVQGAPTPRRLHPLPADLFLPLAAAAEAALRAEAGLYGPQSPDGASASDERRYGIPEIASRERCSPSTVRRAIKHGELRASKSTGKWLCASEDIEHWRRLGENAKNEPPTRLGTAHDRPRRSRRSPASDRRDRPGGIQDLKAIRQQLQAQ